MQEPFELISNKLTFKQLDMGGQLDGVQLSHDEKEYLLPHFLMLLVGKPGSGKTTLLRQLLANGQMYNKKFDDVFIVSPSHSKMGIKTKRDHTTATFNLDWIFDKISDISDEQLELVFGQRLHVGVKEKKGLKGTARVAEAYLNDSKSRFLVGDMFKTTPGAQGAAAAIGAQTQAKKKDPYDRDVFMQKKYEELKRLPREQQEATHRNVLFVFDDVVGSIKKAEYDPRLAQLVMNRRHLVFNGTISIIMVTQKYSLIPSRVRSNASWVIVFQLNPQDFDTLYRDAVVLPQQTWRNVLGFVFGKEINTVKGKPGRAEPLEDQEETKGEEVEDDDLEKRLKIKKFENLGVWVESNIYFKNFKRIKL